MYGYIRVIKKGVFSMSLINSVPNNSLFARNSYESAGSLARNSYESAGSLASIFNFGEASSVSADCSGGSSSGGSSGCSTTCVA